MTPLLLAILSVACATPPHDLSVTLDEFSTGATLQLANQSHSGFQGLYSEPHSQANVKLVPDEVMHRLVDQLESEGFDAYARPAAETAVGAAGYSGMITLAEDSRRRIFALTRTRNKTVEEAMAFIRMKQMIREVFSQVFALQTVENPEGEALFEKERERLEQQRKARGGGAPRP